MAESKKCMTGTTIPSKNKVAMCGFASSNFDYVRKYYNNEDFEIWGINQLYKLLPESLNGKGLFSRWFQMHHKERFLEWDIDQVKKLNQLDIPIYMIERHNDIPKSIAYPRHEICSNRIFNEQYFTNCFTWMLALAIYEDLDEVHLIGCDMMLDHEVVDQRRGIEYLIGVLRGMGKTVVVNSANDLMKHFSLYGYDDDDLIHKKTFHFKKRRTAEKQKIQEHLNQSRDALNQFIGAKDALLDIGHKDEERFKKIDTEMMRLDRQIRNDEKNIAKLEGMIEQQQAFEKTWMNKRGIEDEELRACPDNCIRDGKKQ